MRTSQVARTRASHRVSDASSGSARSPSRSGSAVIASFLRVFEKPPLLQFARDQGACPAETLPESVGSDPADGGRFGGLHALDADQQQRFAVLGRERGERGFDPALQLV